MLVLAIVITSNGSGADIGLVADRGVTKVSEMHRLCATADGRFLGLDKITDGRPLTHMHRHAEMRKWAHRTVILDVRSNDYAMILYRYAVSQRGVYDPRARQDLTGFTDDAWTFDMNIGMNDTVAAEPCFAADITMCGIDEGHPGIQHQSADGTATHQVFEFGQLCPRVDT